MDKLLLQFLKNYSTDTHKIDRLLVSSFLYINEIICNNNLLLKSYVINKGEADYTDVETFIRLKSVMTFENLVEIFEYVISPVDKIISGAVYTPKEIRDSIINLTLEPFTVLDDIKICDPACGCCGFIYTAAIRLKKLTGKSFKQIFEVNMFGIDIQEYSITRSKILLSLLAVSQGEDTEIINFNLHRGNSLSFSWGEIIPGFKGFEILVGNPPYVSSKNIDDESRSLLSKWSVTATGHPDLYIPFFQLGIESLVPGGVLGYITMNTFFKSVNGRAIRDYLATNGWNLTILDFGGFQVFKSKNTYTCIFILRKIPSDFLTYSKLPNTYFEEIPPRYPISYELLKSIDGWNLSNYAVIQQIENIGSHLGRLYKTRNGIATLKNDVYIFDPIREDKNYYYFLKSNRVIQIERAICKDIVNPNKLTRLDEIETIRKKVIFPYTYVDNIAEIIPETELKQRFPSTYAYLLENVSVLASRDKGKGKYETWYAYGRRQSFERNICKLFFPHITSVIPFFVINKDPNLLFHNGIAIIDDELETLLILQKLLKSRLFWFYITNVSKPYASGYFSLSRNYIKNFGVYNFSAEQKSFIIRENDQEVLDAFFEKLYQINFDELNENLAK